MAEESYYNTKGDHAYRVYIVLLLSVYTALIL